MTDPFQITGKRARGQGMSIDRKGLSFVCHGDNPQVSAVMRSVTDIGDGIADLVLKALVGSRLGFVTYEHSQGLRVIKRLARPVEMLPQLRLASEVLRGSDGRTIMI